jgi:hypothetical protein
MKHFFEIKEEASQEVIEAYRYYESKQEGLGERFFKRVEDTYKRIDYHPEGYQKIHKSFRAAKVRNFPYQVIYEIEEKSIIVYSIFNTYQDPVKKKRDK